MKITDLQVSVEDKKIVHGLNLEVKDELAVIMGPNGSGKSSLCMALMGHPRYKAEGSVILDGKEIIGLSPDERAKQGLFLGFQYPTEVAGVSIETFLRTAYDAKNGGKVSIIEFRKILAEKMEMLGVDPSFAKRNLNEGFSGGEKKRAEILQLAVLEPSFVILDEIDSGLDIDALKIVAKGINKLRKGRSFLIITHYQRLLDYVKPDSVHVMIDGKIVKSGDEKLAHELENEGYEAIGSESIKLT